MTVQGLIGKKVGMTHLFTPEGWVRPVTVLQAGICTVTQVRTVVKDGYEAAQLGFEEARRLNRPKTGHLKRSHQRLRYLREVPVADLSEVQVGQQVDVSLFQPGQRVDVTGLSKGRGFQGGVKRHGFRGGPKTHGQSDRHRAPGSIGGTTFPARVFKGKRMAGHMGDRRVTVQNLEVVQADPERNLLYVKGAVPGSRNGLLLICRAVKERVKERQKQGASGGASD